MKDLIERQAAIDALSYMCSEDENGITVSRANVNSMLRVLPSADSSIPISWIEKYIDWLNGSGDGISEIIAFNISLMVHRWKGDCPLPRNFFPDDKRKENER